MEVDDGWAGKPIGNGILRANHEQESGACEAVVRSCEQNEGERGAADKKEEETKEREK